MTTFLEVIYTICKTFFVLTQMSNISLYPMVWKANYQDMTVGLISTKMVQQPCRVGRLR
ncbi:TRAM LAG1 and CLN8 (TLC) lipid-sensing domain containing protein [Zea mays]|uniref:TRAM LAG1 and CLN8 (TLC) lipid-sensing domain containing protein n=1 Tax=Zea mays TaxID=4577 RepID=A0A1D6LCY9_MAIZE|nr:TRAM LAG1 and CLN8 (TLC) lipid-sensing domain containing protein [Zea mays]